MQIVYGGIRQGSVTVQLQNHYQKPFDRIRIGNTTYKVDYTRKLRVKQTFILSEVVCAENQAGRNGKLQVKLKKNVQMSKVKQIVKDNGSSAAGGRTEKSSSGYW